MPRCDICGKVYNYCETNVPELVELCNKMSLDEVVDICPECVRRKNTTLTGNKYKSRRLIPIPYESFYDNSMARVAMACYGADLPLIPKITKVIFNDPATIVFWEDGTKTVVKAHDEEFDPEKGLAMAITKKALGNDSYYPEIKKWTKTYYEKEDAPQDNPGMIIFNGIKRLSDEAVKNLSSLLGTEGL